MYKRTLISKLKELSKKYPVCTITGPRQSGKTTLCRLSFPSYKYVSLEDPDTRYFASSDPRAFLEQYSEKVILDEIQRVPALLSYLQTHVDRTNASGQFILTGSQNFLLSEKISQSLAGRTVLLHLLPLSIKEISQTVYSNQSLDSLIIRGGYPRLYDKQIAPIDFFPSYITTYLERDVRLIKNITDYGAFERFLRLCAGRIGQLLNLSSLANECSITHNTAKAWLSVLEASFIIFLLRPHYQNFNKRIVKMPKLYFYDTGVVCSLLGIENENHLRSYYLRGSLFENLIISEFKKFRFHHGKPSNFYFWRDKLGNEIDCILEDGDTLTPVEIKSGQTVTSDYFKGLFYWQRLSGIENGFVVYGGDKVQHRSNATVLDWRNCNRVFAD